MYHLASFAMLEVGASHYPIPPMVNVILKIHPSLALMPFGRVYTYPYMPPLIAPSPPVAQTKVNSTMLLT